jgi:5-methylcytosine-specific restriction endonuclease McrA
MKRNKGKGNPARRMAVWRNKYNLSPIVPCCHCKMPLRPHQFTLEHLIPFSIGGNGTLENWDIACRRCNNMRKSDLNWKWEGTKRKLAKNAVLKIEREKEVGAAISFDSFSCIEEMVFC